MLNMIDKEIFVPITDLAKHVSTYINKAKSGGALYIMKNNKPEVVLMNVDEYNRLVMLSEYIEQSEIYKIIEERKNSTEGSSLSEVMNYIGISDKDLD